MRLQRISADHEEVKTDQRDKPMSDSDLSNLLSRLHIGGTPEQQAKFGVPTQFEEVKEHITGLPGRVSYRNAQVPLRHPSFWYARLMEV